MRPMLACNAPTNLKTLSYPLFASTKLDGIRCLIRNGVALSRTLKPIRNHYIQSILGSSNYDGLDGELIVGSPNASDCMRKTSSGVMSIEGEPDFTYYVFDNWQRTVSPYEKCLEILQRIASHPKMIVLPQFLCRNASEVETYEQFTINNGYEGIILRRPDGIYKHGRSTPKEGLLYKLKRYQQDEAIVIGYESLQHNENDAELNELGYIQRSSAQAGKVDSPLLGALIVEGGSLATTFRIGSGFTAAEREALWQQRDNLIGRIVSYKHFPSGSKDRPRHPIFKGFRDPDDL